MAKPKKTSSSKSDKSNSQQTSKKTSKPAAPVTKAPTPVETIAPASDDTKSTLTESAVAASVDPYDQVPYPSHPYSASHPDRMHAMAHMFGIDAPLPDDARVLELGCAAGGNIIPLAVQFPKAKIVGIDLSAKQIAEGQDAIKSLGIKNIELRKANIAELPKGLGKFDYIICHGVFSWVPPNVQQEILKACGSLLTDNGIAYISYNTLPGWYMRNMIRGMLLKHVQGISDPVQKIQQSRALLKFLTESTAKEQTTYARYLREETELLNRQSDQYLFHEHLEEYNSPMFFRDFMDMAAGNGLQFLGEASLASMWIGNLPAEAVKTLEGLTQDVVTRGQYADFVRNRTFRQTLLCRTKLTVNRQLSPDSLAQARIVGRLTLETPASDLNLTGDAEVAYRSPAGHRVASREPVYKAMLSVISEAFPQSLSIAEICQRIEERIATRLQVASTPLKVNSVTVATNLIQLLLAGVFDFRFTPDRLRTTVADKPNVFAWARWQAQSGNQLTNLRHEMVRVCDVTRIILPMTDGTRTREQLAKEMLKKVQEGKLNLQASAPLTDAQKLDFLKQMLDKILGQMSANSLLAVG